MDIFRKIYAFMAAALVLAACHGVDDSTSRPVLTVDDTEIDLAVETHAVFTVTLDGVDITDQAHINCRSNHAAEIKDAVFTPEYEGEYKFTAVYGDAVSDPVKVMVVNSKPQVDSKFRRHVCVMEFTGTWCAMCPQGFTTMNATLQSSDRYKNYVHVIAMHDDDEYTIAATDDFFAYCSDLCKGGLAYPSFTTDLRDANLLTTGEGAAEFSKSLRTSFNDYGPYCGVSVSSALTDGGKKAEIVVGLESEFAADYRVIVFVVEDRITGFQKGVQGYPDGQQDYLHRHVARKLVTSYGPSGEKIWEISNIPAGQEARKTWTIDVDPVWNLEHTEIYAIALGADGFVNNMNVCHIDGGDSGYDLK